MFNIKELSKETTEILYLLKEDLQKDLKYYTKTDNNTMIQLVKKDIETITKIIEKREEK